MKGKRLTNVPTCGTLKKTLQEIYIMREITVNKFRANLRDSVEQVLSEHQPLRISRRNGQDFIVIGADDWIQNQETLAVLENSSLMKQIAESMKTHKEGTGYTPNAKELDEINCI